MKKILVISSVIIFASGLYSCGGKTKTKTISDQELDSMKIARGAFLVTIGDCNVCHSPKIFTEHGPVPDPERLFSGHPSDLKLDEYDHATASKWALFNGHMTAIVGPWGTSFAANISSDASGIGNWTEEQFIKAMREGKSKGLDGGRMILPPMPWENLGKLSDDDLKAILAYLKSTKPIYNVVPAPQPPLAVN